MSGDPDPGRAKPQRPKTQVGALCFDPTTGLLLLITSRETRRWVIPKGWPMRKRSLPDSALQEAWEEAGIEGEVGKHEIGRYGYDKRRRVRQPLAVEVRIFPVAVTRLADTYPEASQRERFWCSAAEASGLVDEAGLQAVFVKLPPRLTVDLLSGPSSR